MQTLTLWIEGVHCEHCTQRLSRLLKAEPGVRDAAVPFAAGGDAWVRFNPYSVSRERLVALVEEAEFRVVEVA